MCAKKRDIYLMSNGQPVTEGSASTLCGIIDKSEKLTPWAAKVVVEKVAEFWLPDQSFSKQHIELALGEAKRAPLVRKDTAGDIGTEVHSIVGAYVEGQLAPDGIEHKEKRRSLENFIKTTEGWEWLGSEIVVINEWCECPLSPDKYPCETLSDCPNLRGYGGTADAIARLPDGRVHLIDFKTSNTIQATYSMQCALYAAATPTGDYAHLRTVWQEIEEARILHFNKEFLTWENLERDIKEQMPYIQHFIGCRRWKKKFDNKSYSQYKDNKTEAQEVGNTLSFSSSQ